MSHINFTARTALALLLAGSAVACGTSSEADPASRDAVECVGDVCDDGALAFDPGAGDGTEVGVCAEVSATFEVVTPTVVLLIDQSGSMTDDYDGQSRWDALYDAVMAPGDGVVSALDDQVRFGLALYTSEDGDAGPTCPMLQEVDVAMNNYHAMDDLYAAAQPDEDTPTGEALSAVAGKLAALDSDGPKIIILATDGEPDTCAIPDPRNGEEREIARGVSLDAAADAYADGIRTIVLGVGDGVGADHLQDMANAGAGLSEGATFYQPQNKQGLVEAFDDIVAGATSCILPLTNEIDAATAEGGEVYLDDDALTYGEDYRLLDGKHIELLGAACETAKSGDHEVTGHFTCGADAEVGDLPR